MNSMSPEKLATAAEMLWAARTNARVIERLPDDVQPRSIDESYRLQALLNQKLQAVYGQPIGYKIGCTTEVMQQYLRIPHPCSGQIFESTVQFGSGEFSWQSLCRPGVECEIAVVLDRDMPAGRTYTAECCGEFVGMVMPSIELVDDRWRDYRTIDVHSLIAENFFGAGCVFGNPVPPAPEKLASTTGVLYINGEERGAGIGADILGHPYQALAWLANHQVKLDTHLRAGDYISLGSVVKTYWLEVGDMVEIKFDGLGACSLRLVA